MRHVIIPLLTALLYAIPMRADTLTDMQGVAHDLSAITQSGRNVVLVFWQSWCGPCKKEAPRLALAAKEHGKHLAFIGVVSGPDQAVDKEQVEQFVTKYALPYPQVRDRDLTLTKTFNVKGTPTLIVLDRNNKVLYSGHRSPEDWSPFYAL